MLGPDDLGAAEVVPLRLRLLAEDDDARGRRGSTRARARCV